MDKALEIKALTTENYFSCPVGARSRVTGVACLSRPFAPEVPRASRTYHRKKPRDVQTRIARERAPTHPKFEDA